MHTTPRLLLDSLKRCPLCEAVNAGAAPACFVCGWAGAFDHDADDVRASVEEIMARCPEFADVKPRPKWKVWLKRVLARIGTRSV